MKPYCPCRKDHGDCNERSEDCHGTCKDYKVFRKLLDEQNAKEKEYKAREAFLDSLMYFK